MADNERLFRGRRMISKTKSEALEASVLHWQENARLLVKAHNDETEQ